MSTSALVIQRHEMTHRELGEKQLGLLTHIMTNPKLYLRILHNAQQEINNYKIRNLGEIAQYVIAIEKAHDDEIDKIDDDIRTFHAAEGSRNIAYESIDEKYESMQLDIFKHFGVTSQQFYTELNQRVANGWIWRHFA